METIKNIKNQKEKIISYWSDEKEKAKKAYQEIYDKEKEMLDVCEKAEKTLKDAILKYKTAVTEKTVELSAKALPYKEQEIQDILNDTTISEEEKSNDVELLENLPYFSTNYFPKIKGLNFQKRWNIKVLDEKSVPAYFDDCEIRPIKTAKILEMRKQNPNINIPGIEFYQQENVIIKK